MPTVSPLINLNDTTPAAPTGRLNISWQADALTPRGVSANIPNIGNVDARTTTSETVALASQGKLVTFTNAGAIAVTLNSAAVAAGFFCAVAALGAGAATLTPSSGTINGAANLVVSSGSGGWIFFDGANWKAVIGGGFTPAGDLSGTSSSQTVVGLQGKGLDAATVGSPSNGQIIQYDSALGKYKATALAISSSVGQGGALFTATADATAAGGTGGAQTLIGAGAGSLTIPANWFAAGLSILVLASGHYSTGAITTQTLQLLLKFGAVTILDTTALAPPGSVTNGVWTLAALITCRSIGATGKFIANARVLLNTSTTAVQGWEMENHAELTVDTTGTNAVTLTATWVNGTGSETMTGTNFAMGPVTGYPGTGSIAISQSAMPATLNLSTEGTKDWFTCNGQVQNGANIAATSLHRKILGGWIASSFCWIIESGTQFTQAAAMTVSTTTGDDTNAALTTYNTDVGVYKASGTGEGFCFQVPASTVSKTLRIYCSLFSGVMTLKVRLSDGSAADATDTVTATAGHQATVQWNVVFQSAHDGAWLTIEVYLTTNSGSTPNVKFQGATLF